MKVHSFDDILSLVPRCSEDAISWDDFARLGFASLFEKMEATEQNPAYHAEGNVFLHTKMVAQALICLPEYAALTKEEQNVLFLAAMLHDAGKTFCTTIKDGEIASPYHSVKGGVWVRTWLWKQFDLAGAKEKRSLRESISLLVKHHSFPPFAHSHRDGERRILAIAENARLTKPFSIHLLYLLSKADVMGRISSSREEHLEQIECFKMMAEDLGCLYEPYAFASDFSKRAYFKRQSSFPGDSLYDSCWGEIVMLAVLPGSGKDTYAKKKFPHLEMISLDDIRQRMGVLPTENQSVVAAEFQKAAKERLRQKKAFLFNATNLSADLRKKQIDLFEKYGAKVRLIFIETAWAEEMARNESRAAEVPRAVIEKMLTKLEIPEANECEIVVWETT